MKTFKISFFAFVLMIFSYQANSQIIAFDKIIYNYGIISDTLTKIPATFIVRNIGDKPLLIIYAHPSCECVSVEYTKDTIMPGNMGSVTLYFNPKGFAGFFTKTVSILSNSIESQEVNLTLKGTIKQISAAKEIEYPYFFEQVIRARNITLDLGKIYYPEIKTDTAFLYNPQDTAVTISFPNLANYIQVKMLPSNTLKPNEEGMIIISYDPAKKNDWGSVLDKVYMSFEGKKTTYKSRITLSGLITEDFSKLSKKQLKAAPHIEFSKIEVNFDTIKQGEKVECLFPFSNTGKSTLIIRKIKTSCGCTVGKLEKLEYKQGEKGEVKVTFSSDHKDRDNMQIITVITNDPKNPEKKLTIKGYVKLP